jgi:LmbE family N-acetylglucosaminyl deacetylase
MLQRIFLLYTDRDPTVFVDVNAVYATKLAASMAHHSQFPKGEENLDWMKALDAKAGERINVTYAEKFKHLEVW